MESSKPHIPHVDIPEIHRRTEETKQHRASMGVNWLGTGPEKYVYNWEIHRRKIHRRKIHRRKIPARDGIEPSSKRAKK